MGAGVWYLSFACVVGASRWLLVRWFCSCGGLIKEAVSRLHDGVHDQAAILMLAWFGGGGGQGFPLAVVSIQGVGVRHLGFVCGRHWLVKLILFLQRFDLGGGMVQPARPVLSGRDQGQNVITTIHAPIRGALIMQPLG